MRQLPHLTRCPPPSGTIQFPHSGLTQGTAPVDSSPLRVSNVLHVSKARLSFSFSSFAASVLPPLPASLAHEYALSKNTCADERANTTSVKARVQHNTGAGRPAGQLLHVACRRCASRLNASSFGLDSCQRGREARSMHYSMQRD